MDHVQLMLDNVKMPVWSSNTKITRVLRFVHTRCGALRVRCGIVRHVAFAAYVKTSHRNATHRVRCEQTFNVARVQWLRLLRGADFSGRHGRQ